MSRSAVLLALLVSVPAWAQLCPERPLAPRPAAELDWVLVQTPEATGDRMGDPPKMTCKPAETTTTTSPSTGGGSSGPGTLQGVSAGMSSGSATHATCVSKVVASGQPVIYGTVSVHIEEADGTHVLVAVATTDARGDWIATFPMTSGARYALRVSAAPYDERPAAVAPAAWLRATRRGIEGARTSDAVCFRSPGGEGCLGTR